MFREATPQHTEPLAVVRGPARHVQADEGVLVSQCDGAVDRVENKKDLVEFQEFGGAENVNGLFATKKDFIQVMCV